MKKYTRVFAEIDLDAICFNMESMKRNLPQKTEMIGVVKADAYGHGSVPIAGAISPYVKGYAVATAQEALLLRRHGIEKPVLILGPVHESYYEELILHRIRPCVFTMKQAEALSRKAVSLGQTADFHLVVDTGMSRIGMEADEAGADLAVRICSLPGIRAEGLFTHFARADETDKIYAERQLGRYLYFVKLLGERGIEIPIRHCANSAGIIDLIGTGLDWVRAGISIYGLYPSDQVNKSRAELRPAMALKSFVTYVKDIEPGRQVSYGGTFEAKAPMRIATIPVGYGDGYPRNLSGRGFVLIQGQRVPILGRVCMDQMMVDVTGMGQVDTDTPVTLIGRDGAERIRVEDLAEWSGGFHYEIICDVGKRVPRVYLRAGQVVGTKDYFDDEYPKMR